MPNYRRAARRAARREGLDPNLFERQIGAESGFNPNARSPAGARGIAQFMPATARGMGVNLNDNRAADDLAGAARLMARYVKRYGSYARALEAYNAGPGGVGKGYAETRAYVAKVMGGRGDQTRVGRRSSPGGTRGPRAGTRTVGGVDRSGERQAVLQGYLQQRGRPGALLSLAQGLQGAQDTPPRTVRAARGRRRGGTAARRGARGRVTVAAGADRPGVRTKPQVVRFAERVSGIAGVPVAIGTGTRHSRLTVNGNVSNHWTGDAADIPARGDRLIRLGQAALVAAGVPERKARRARGGLYNVGDWQIIFNTQEGGDHTGHLHAGYRGR